jgi:hypothetical protein
MIYVIGAFHAGRLLAVKVGFSLYPRDRLESLQTGSPLKLEVLTTRPGDRLAEVALHRAMQAWRLRGEWFSPTIDVLGILGIEAPGEVGEAEPLAESVERFRGACIDRALEQTCGNRTAAAELLKCNVRTVFRHVAKNADQRHECHSAESQ